MNSISNIDVCKNQEIIKSRDVVFIERSKEISGVPHPEKEKM